MHLWPFSDLPWHGKSPCFKFLVYFSFQEAVAKKERKKETEFCKSDVGGVAKGADTFLRLHNDNTQSQFQNCPKTQHSHWAFFLLDVSKGL